MLTNYHFCIDFPEFLSFFENPDIYKRHRGSCQANRNLKNSK